MNLRPLLLIGILLISSLAFGQRQLKKAEKLYCKYAFAEAINHYKDYIDKTDDPDPVAYMRLGECYRNIDNPSEAVRWLKKSVQHAETSPDDFIIYAEMLQQTKDLDEAGNWFQRYLDEVPGAFRAQQGLESIANMKYLTTNPNNYFVQNVEQLNSSASDISPMLYKDKFIFASDRDATKYSDKTFDWTGGNFYNLFQCEEKAPGKLSYPKILTGNANSVYHDGPVTFTEDGSHIILCRTHDQQAETKGDCPNREVYNLKLVSADYRQNSGEWGSISDKEFRNINHPDFNVMHPTVSPDGNVLYFASDNPNFQGYQGGMDIYMSVKGDKGVWSRPVNLGETVNSPGNEAFPFIARDSVLYFSSDANLGQGGLGGLDIYRAEYNRGKMEYMRPENLGAPINSTRDDFGFILTENDRGDQYGYFSSSRGTDENKNAQGKDDIYYFKARKPYHLKLMAYDGCAKERIPNARFVLMEGLDTVHVGRTNTNGLFTSDSLLRMNKKYTTRAYFKYGDKATAFVTDGLQSGDTVLVKVNFDVQRILSGTIYNKRTEKPLANARVKITNRETGESRTTYADSEGYFLIQVDAEADYSLVASKFGYQAEEATVQTTDEKCQDIRQNFNLTPATMFLTNVYYFFDKAYINNYPEALSDLNDLVEYLNDNPDYKIEIRSHTDSRAGLEYNERLAQRRAQSVKDYLIDNGISEDRLNPVSYGEYCLANECSDGVPCTEVQHQRNRRTVVKVINYQGEMVVATREKEKWTKEEAFYVEGGLYFEEGKGSNWKEDENFEGKYGNWREIPVRKNCDDVLIGTGQVDEPH